VKVWGEAGKKKKLKKGLRNQCPRPSRGTRNSGGGGLLAGVKEKDGKITVERTATLVKRFGKKNEVRHPAPKR